MADKIVNKKLFEVTVDGQKHNLAVVRPTNAVTQKATLVFNKAWRTAVEAGSLTRPMLDKYLRDAKLWDDNKQVEFEAITKKIRDAERAMLAGGVTRAKFQEMGLELRRLRIDQRQMIARKNEEDLKTADAFADNARFNYLVSACTVDAETGKPYYASVDDYETRENDPAAYVAAQHLSELLYNLDPKFEENLVENKLMKKFGIVDESLHLVDKQGRKVDTKGRLVNDEGRFIDEKGEFVDGEGRPLTADGDYVIEFAPLLDDGPAVGKSDGDSSVASWESDQRVENEKGVAH